VSRWGMARLDSSREEGDHHDHAVERYDDGRVVRPQTESEEERMMRIATEASLKDWEERVGYGKNSKGEIRSNSKKDNRSSQRGNGQRSGSHRTKKRHSANNLTAIGEDNLIDFDTDEMAIGVPHINILERGYSDVSALDDDATTASFMMNTALPVRQPPPMGPIHNTNQQQSSHFTGQDPTFRAQYAQQPWSSVGTLSTPRNRFGSVPPSDASFAVPPAPTLDDYEDAFGGSAMNVGASVMGGPAITVNPMSPASPGAPHHTAQQYGMQQAPPQMAPQQQWQSQSFGAPGAGAGVAAGGPGKRNSFDPFRADPFAS